MRARERASITRDIATITRVITKVRKGTVSLDVLDEESRRSFLTSSSLALRLFARLSLSAFRSRRVPSADIIRLGARSGFRTVAETNVSKFSLVTRIAIVTRFRLAAAESIVVVSTFFFAAGGGGKQTRNKEEEQSRLGDSVYLVPAGSEGGGGVYPSTLARNR